MRKLIASSLLFLAWTPLSAAQNQPRRHPVPFLVSISEGTTDLSRNGVNVHDCILVQPDGRFHLERRMQQLPNPTATLDVFESSLDLAQLQVLRSTLNNDSIQRLPSYVLPAIPMSVPWFRGFHAKIARGTEVQSVGYWVWRGGDPATSPNSTPDSTKRDWHDSEVALRPLVEWFDGTKALKLGPSAAKSTLCSGGGDLGVADAESSE
jgi:hypothetical protein